MDAQKKSVLKTTFLLLVAWFYISDFQDHRAKSSIRTGVSDLFDYYNPEILTNEYEYKPFLDSLKLAYRDYSYNVDTRNDRFFTVLFVKLIFCYFMSLVVNVIVITDIKK